jgi:hypothetical protein
MNPITERMSTGCVGELLVQLRLLQLGVQAAPPIEDSGNDLIAVNQAEFRAVSVRTTTTGTYTKPDTERRYHVLAVVHLMGEDRELHLDRSRVFLIPKAEVAGASCNCDNLDVYGYSRDQVERLFGTLAT